MPNPERDEPEESRADAAGLLEYIDRRRLHQARQRRQRLAVSNMILLKRLSTRGQTPPPAAVETAPPEAPAPARPAETSPPTAAPAPPAPAAATTTPPPEARAPVPPSPPSAPIPPRVPTAPPAAVAPPVTGSTPAASDGDAAQRTARWMVETHGRVEAENRAARVAEFYTGEERAFWRRVLLNVRQEPR